jgi:hypothetical protein
MFNLYNFLTCLYLQYYLFLQRQLFYDVHLYFVHLIRQPGPFSLCTFVISAEYLFMRSNTYSFYLQWVYFVIVYSYLSVQLNSVSDVH